VVLPFLFLVRTGVGNTLSARSSGSKLPKPGPLAEVCAFCYDYGSLSWPHVRFKTLQEILYQAPAYPVHDARITTVIKAVLVLDGTELCAFGYCLSRHVAASP
jgi:hypothetical protein